MSYLSWGYFVNEKKRKIVFFAFCHPTFDNWTYNYVHSGFCYDHLWKQWPSFIPKTCYPSGRTWAKICSSSGYASVV